VNEGDPDGQFFSWLGQFQWVQQLSPRALMIARLNAQFTPDALLSIERFSIGGSDTVRGYRQNQVVADNGIIGSLEFRLPLTKNPQTLQLNPFFEFGTGWNQRGDNPTPQWIVSLGLGLQWQISRDVTFRADYGFPLVNIQGQGDSLQDDGFSFSLRYQPL
jgi:hemolysin activation/secretion protein